MPKIVLKVKAGLTYLSSSELLNSVRMNQPTAELNLSTRSINIKSSADYKQ